MHPQNKSFFIPAFRFFLVLFFIFLLNSCNNSPFPGFSETEDGTYFKLQRFGESERKARSGDVLKIDYAEFNGLGFPMGHVGNAYYRHSTSIADTGGHLTQIRKIFENNSGINDMNVSEGDSFTVIVPHDGKVLLRIEMKILKLLTFAEYEAEQKLISEVGDIEENKTLKKYIEENKITIEPVHNGMYIIPMKEGKGDSVKAGRMISLVYKGYFLDGREFDATEKRSPLEFIYGTEMQVIKGIQVAISSMREGDKSKIIIPSHFAFGEKGSSTGVVPPFTTVIYEVEIIKVK